MHINALLLQSEAWSLLADLLRPLKSFEHV